VPGKLDVPTSRTRALNLANYPTGASQLPEATLPDWAVELTIEIARCTSAEPDVWPLRTTKLVFALEYTFDGTTWLAWQRGESWGGIDLNKLGVEIEYLTFSAPFTPGVNRKVRGTLTIEGGPLRTTAFITLSS